MLEQDTQARRRELGAFVRALRERVTPAEAGLVAPTRRRTPGLRREDVALLAGLSATWYTWIEQGRDVSVSPVSLARLASALRMDRAERAYLFALAGKRDPHPAVGPSEAPGAAMMACVQGFRHPAYVMDRAWNVRAWNAAAERLFAGWLDAPGPHNLLRFIFLAPLSLTLIDDWPDRASRVVAEFRAHAGLQQQDPEIASLIADLTAASPDFTRLWQQRGVHEREGGIRVFNHPADGRACYEQLAFTVEARPGIKLTVLVPADAAGG
ncbi:MAG: helix-turn-helix transcriptional regulator [Acetobacteraceae bacterium]